MSVSFVTFTLIYLQLPYNITRIDSLSFYQYTGREEICLSSVLFSLDVCRLCVSDFCLLCCSDLSHAPPYLMWSDEIHCFLLNTAVLAKWKKTGLNISLSSKVLFLKCTYLLHHALWCDVTRDQSTECMWSDKPCHQISCSYLFFITTVLINFKTDLATSRLSPR